MARWQPGQSGNPSGRPRIVGEVQSLARRHTKRAIKTLSEIMQDEKAPPAARVAAASAILDRGYGRPIQPQHHTGEINLSLAERIEQAFRRLGDDDDQPIERSSIN
jgi:hypothetical protein